MKSHLVNLRLLLAFVWCATVCNPGALIAQSFRIEQTDKAITVYDSGDKVVLTYNKVSPQPPEGIDSVYHRSGCLHPVCTPKGRIVTAMFPFDHPHQHGIFSAWVKTKYAGQDIDFWNMAGRTGRVLHERVDSTFQKDQAVGFVVDLIHRAETKPQIDVLRERWKITIYPTDGSYRCFDLQTVQSALTEKPLTVSKNRYGGVAVRGPTRWLTEKDPGAVAQPDLVREQTGFLNNLGSNRVTGNHQKSKWVALWGNIEGEPVSITVLCHKDNLRAPQTARLHPTKPYFCFSPCVDAKFVIDREHPYQATYRFLVADTQPNANWLTEQWDRWCGM